MIVYGCRVLMRTNKPRLLTLVVEWRRVGGGRLGVVFGGCLEKVEKGGREVGLSTICPPQGVRGSPPPKKKGQLMVFWYVCVCRPIDLSYFVRLGGVRLAKLAEFILIYNLSTYTMQDINVFFTLRNITILLRKFA